MKKVLYALGVVFVVGMAVTIYVSTKSYEGLVDDRYSEKGEKYFQTKKDEEDIRLVITEPPPEFPLGDAPYRVRIMTGSTPLRGARVTLFTGLVSSKMYDKFFTLGELEPGVYGGTLKFPAKGRWLLRLDVTRDAFATDRKWFAEVVD